MRLQNFRLERYGPFEQLDLPFDAAPGRINLIVAPNGFGKSVIRRSIGDFLFGIENRTPMTFRFGTEKMRLLAEVSHNGTTSGLVRRKGNGNTLARAGGPEVPSDETARLLGGASETVFHELFGLDTTLLRSGGLDLIRSQGRLGQVLFAAGGGMGRIRDLLTELERKRDDLGKASARHRSRPLWNALSNWEQGGQDLRRAAMRPDNWTALEREAVKASQDLADLIAEHAGEGAERERLRTIGACRPWLDRLHAAECIEKDAADAPQIDDGFEKRWRDALTAQATSASSAQAAAADLQSARDDRARLAFDPAWIAAEADIKALGDLRGQAIGAERDLPVVERALAADRTKAASLRRDLGWSDGFPLPPATVVKDAQRRLQQHPKLALDAAAAQDRLEEADRALAATQAELDALPAATGAAALTDLCVLLRAEGDPGTRLETGRRKLREAEAALRSALSAVPDCALAEAALSTTAAPSENRLEAAGKALSQAENTQAQAARTHAERLRSIETERSKLGALERSAMLPPPDALATARADRDSIWARFCSAAPDVAAVAVDRAIREADAVADALIRHGREAAEAAAMRERLETLGAAADSDAEAVTRAGAAVTEARNDLIAIARAAGGNAEDIGALRTFLRAREAAITARDARDTAAAGLADIEANLSALSLRLASALDTAMPELAAIGTLLGEADRRVEADRTLSAQRKTLTEQAARQRAACAGAAAAVAKAERALTEWQSQWAPVAATLSRPDTETAATTADALSRIEELRAAERDGAENQRRVEDMHAAIALLTKQVVRLAALSPDIAALPPIEAAEAFRRRLQGELNEAARCADADRRIEQAIRKQALAAAEAETAARTMTGLRAALRAETDDEAEHQLQRARAVAAARRDKAEAMRQLAVQGGGLSLEILQARAAETSADADTARIAAIEASQQARAPRIEAARAARDTAVSELEKAGTGIEAAEAAQRREAAQAMLSRTAEEALLLHATHALLQTALDRQAAGASQPLLARIGEVFRTITRGAQAGVRIEDSRDGQTMVALEADGATRKSLDQLSEGTSDQLYLALRIAALEDYAATTSPLPFIADDILQTFDDSRTEATMQALLELSQLVQVIVLTHHSHIGDLADRLGHTQVMRLAA